MWNWVLLGYVVVLIALVACAGAVAVFVREDAWARRAHRVLRTMITALTGGTGVLVVLLWLYQAGIVT